MAGKLLATCAAASFDMVELVEDRGSVPAASLTKDEPEEVAAIELI